MPERAQSLADFYGGPVWQNHRETANATMVNSDDVLLMRPARAASTFTIDSERPPHRADDSVERGVVEATILQLEAPADEEILEFFEGEISPGLVDAGASILAYFVTEASENTFPTLPVREGENVFVWFAGFAASDERAAPLHAVGQAPGLKRAPQTLRLASTSRSLLTGLSDR